MGNEKSPQFERDRHVQYCEIGIGSWTGNVTAEHLFDPKGEYGRGGHTSGIWRLEDALPDLVEGGYVIDRRPLADNPNIMRWVLQEPLSSGELSGEVERISDHMRVSAAGMIPLMDGELRGLAYLLASGALNSDDEPAGGFDRVSSEYRATYWLKRGARVGIKRNGKLHWSDGVVEKIPDID